MYTINKNNVLAYNEELLNEVYSADVLLNATICCCKEREFRGEYYGIPQNFVHNISNERNEYLSLLTMLSDKIKSINILNRRVEEELILH